jgi:hypothetical protein
MRPGILGIHFRQLHLYIDIIKPLGHRAKERNEAFQAEYAIPAPVDLKIRSTSVVRDRFSNIKR